MNELKERAAYLRGLLEGADFVQDPKQKLVWEGLMDFCDGVAQDMEEMGDSQSDFADYIEAIDEDLSTLEKYFYNQEEDEEDEVVFTAGDHQAVMELTCPRCKEEIYFEDEPGNYEVMCPECGSVVWDTQHGEHGAHGAHGARAQTSRRPDVI